MESTLEYPIEAVFKDRNSLEEEIKKHGLQEDGSVLLAGSARYEAFYSPEKDKILLKIKGESEEEKVKVVEEFFRWVDGVYRK